MEMGELIKQWWKLKIQLRACIVLVSFTFCRHYSEAITETAHNSDHILYEEVERPQRLLMLYMSTLLYERVITASCLRPYSSHRYW